MEQSSRCERMAEKEEIMNRSEILTETQEATGRQENRGDGHDNDNETWQGGQQEQENTT